MPAKVWIKSCRRAGGCVSFVYECTGAVATQLQLYLTRHM